MNHKTWSAIKVITLFYELAQDEPVALADITRLAGISTSCAEQFFRNFREAGLVYSTKGPGGGYSLARMEISVADVMRAIGQMPEHPFCEPVALALGKVMINQMVERNI